MARWERRDLGDQARVAAGRVIGLTRRRAAHAALRRPRSGRPALMVTTGRSGSHFLMGLLNGHPEVTFHGEILRTGGPQDWPDAAREAGRRDPLSMLHEVVWPETVSPSCVTGFKLHHNHRNAGAAEVWEFLRRLPDLRVIHLTRHDLLAQYVSRLRAGREGRYVFAAGEAVETTPAFPIDPARMLSEFARVERRALRSRRFFADATSLDVRYEDLLRDRGGQMAQVFDFLGVSAIPTPEPTTGVRRRVDTFDEIANADEIRQTLRASRWAHLADADARAALYGVG